MSSYHLDYGQLDLDWLRQRIETHEIVPARRMLQERLSERFGLLRDAGIATMKDLDSVLSSKARIEDFSAQTGLPVEYLVWLGRETRSYRPNPFALRDIPGADADAVGCLEQIGIKTTKGLFDRGATSAGRREIEAETEFDPDVLLELVKLSDLARIRGMGKTFVRLFAESGVDSVTDLATCDPRELHDRLHEVNRERELSSVVPSLKDVAEYVEMARELPKVVEL